MSGDMRITGVSPCSCASHALVEVRSDDGIECREVKVDAASARTVAAELAGLAGDPAPYIDTLAASIEACGGALAAIRLGMDADAARSAHLCIDGRRPVRIRIPAGVALVLAARLGLPVWCRDGNPGAQPDVPAVFRKAFYEPDEPERG
ncbi:MAG: hypothetical protein U5Q44_15320 [Dehalococcoidia bacterium]|nr:hypothetical protein [Dehalococcoidia bacterium]